MVFVIYVHVYVPVEVEKRVLVPFELLLQMVVSHLPWMLGTELWFSGRGASTFNCWPYVQPSTNPLCYFLNRALSCPSLPSLEIGSHCHLFLCIVLKLFYSCAYGYSQSSEEFVRSCGARVGDIC